MYISSFDFKGFGTTISSPSNLNIMRSSPKITCYGSEVHFSQCMYKAVSLWRDPVVCGNDLYQLHCGYGKYTYIYVYMCHTLIHCTYMHTHFCMYMHVYIHVCVYMYMHYSVGHFPDYLFFIDYNIFQPSATLPSAQLISLDNLIPFGNGSLNSIYVRGAAYTCTNIVHT